MLVHLVSTLQQFLESVEADADGYREADGGPEGVASAHPVPETEHVGGIDSELLDFSLIRRKGHEVLGHMGVVSGDGHEPVASRVGVRERLLCGEGLGGDQEQGGFGIQRLERLGDVGAVDVGDENAAEGRR